MLKTAVDATDATYTAGIFIPEDWEKKREEPKVPKPSVAPVPDPRTQEHRPARLLATCPRLCASLKRSMTTQTAQSTFQDPVGKRLQANLRSLGFTGSKQTYRLQAGGYEFTAKVIKSVRNTRDRVSFTIELHAKSRGESAGFWWRRLGQLLPMLNDSWWELVSGWIRSRYWTSFRMP